MSRAAPVSTQFAAAGAFRASSAIATSITLLASTALFVSITLGGCHQGPTPTIELTLRLEQTLRSPHPRSAFLRILVGNEGEDDCSSADCIFEEEIRLDGGPITVEAETDREGAVHVVAQVRHIDDPSVPPMLQADVQTTLIAGESNGVTIDPPQWDISQDSNGDGAPDWTEWFYGCNPSNLPCAVFQIDAGRHHTCALLNGGDISCWGQDDSGQLGTGAPDVATGVPARIGLPRNNTGFWVQVSAGGEHTCAIDDAGNLSCWGSNVFGQLGIPSAANGRSAPESVDPQTPVIPWHAVSAGSEHTCGIRGDERRMYCWGTGADGRLGLGDSVSSANVPTEIDGDLTGWTAVSAGGGHTCGLIGTALYCWGGNTNGELGTGDSQDLSAPQRVFSDRPTLEISTVTAGNGFTCAEFYDPALAPTCWGASYNFQTGSASSEPIVDGGTSNPLGGLSLVTAGGEHGCALGDNTVACWGNYSKGRLGREHSGNDSTVGGEPVPATAQRFAITDGDGVLELSAGGAHTCARTNLGVHCWGDNNSGQLGAGTVGMSAVAVRVGTANDWTEVSAGDRHTCALNAADPPQLSCWGAGDLGQLGAGGDHPLMDSATPTALAAFGGTGTAVHSLDAGSDHTCLIVVQTPGDDSPICWGANDSGQLGSGSNNPVEWTPTAIGSLNIAGLDFVTLSAGRNHTCGVAAPADTPTASSVMCWGRNDDFQSPMADGTTTVTTHIDDAEEMIDITEPRSVAAGSNFNLIANTNDVFGLGAAPFGAGSNGNRQQLATAVAALAVFAGDGYACFSTGAVFCRGDNGSSLDPNNFVQVSSASDWTSFDAGPSHACGVRGGDSVHCFGGDDDFGQNGAGTPNQSDWPAFDGSAYAGIGDGQGNTLTNGIAVTAGGTHSCAIVGTGGQGDLYCWGNNEHGQLGDGEGFSTLPLPVTGL